MFFTVAVIIWRRKKRKAEAREASEQVRPHHVPQQESC